MTVSFRAVGSWENGATGLTADEVLSGPAAQVTGDLVIVIGCWKDFAITAQVSGYTELIEIADGTTATGNGTGSMKIGVWYKIATSDAEADPTLDFSTTTNLLGEGTIIVFSKSEANWLTPEYRQAAWTASGGPQTISAGSTVTVPTGGAVLGIAAIRDDSATFTRATDAIKDSGGLVTWNGNHAEQPATHASTITGNDMACDAGYRLVTTGAAGVTLQMSIDALSASETGNLLWVVLGDAPNPTATSAVSLTSTTTAGTGEEVFTATSAVALPAMTTAATGTEVFTATSAIAGQAATTTATGEHTEASGATGTSAISLTATTVEGAGTEVFTSTSAVNLAATTTAATGTEVFTATSAVSTTATTTAAAGTHAEAATGTSAVNLAAATAAAAGTHTEAVTGTAAVSVAVLTFDASAQVVLTGASAVAMAAATVAATGIFGATLEAGMPLAGGVPSGSSSGGYSIGNTSGSVGSRSTSGGVF
jgi:hypothetical protein